MAPVTISRQAFDRLKAAEQRLSLLEKMANSPMFPYTKTCQQRNHTMHGRGCYTCANQARSRKQGLAELLKRLDEAEKRAEEAEKRAEIAEEAASDFEQALQQIRRKIEDIL